eukprot:m.332058 g.332058  ORF g.332058 m.332058 type:complete len:567 (+) comp16865_c0_seq1:161-1861(+)
MKSIVAVFVGCCLLPTTTGLTYETFLAPPVTLRSGQIANTASDFGGPLPMPKGPVAVRFFNSTIVDKEGNEVPQYELYVHHWVMFSDFDLGNGKSDTHSGGLCSNLMNVWGIGAELRGVTYEYPSPYAILLTGKETFSANLHFIRTTNVPKESLQSCIECRCVDSNPPLHPKGEVACCSDQDQCWGMENSTLHDEKEYFLKYTVGYEPITEQHKPLTVFSMDGTAKNTIDCEIQYQIPALADGEVHVLQTMADVNMSWEIAFMEVHQHIGGINMTVEHFRDGKNVLGEGKFLCSPSAIYGTGTKPGNEKDYLIDIPTCTWEQGYHIQAGDQLRLTSYYNNRGLPGGDPWHSGVMALVFVAAVATLPPEQNCLTRFHFDCGVPPYNSKEQCLGCAQYMESDLVDHNCTKAIVEAECSKVHKAGLIPTPDEVSDMELQVIPINQSTTFVNVTGPKDKWFAVAYNPNVPEMNNSFGFVYAADTNGKPILQIRKLGPHTGGTVVEPSVPGAIISSSDGMVNIQMTVSNPSFKFDKMPTEKHQPGLCWLFAQGTDMNFGYHGATRGSSCQF